MRRPAADRERASIPLQRIGQQQCPRDRPETLRNGAAMTWCPDPESNRDGLAAE